MRYYFIFISNKDKTKFYRRAESPIGRIKNDRWKEDIILSLSIIFADEMGQISAEEISLYDKI